MAVYKTTAYETRRWTFGIMYETTFDAGEGEVETASRRYAAGKPYGSFPKAVREGWWFLEWRDEDGNAVTAQDLVEGPRTLSAVWSDVPTHTPLEWIENSDVGAYIDTGFVPDETCVFEIDFEYDAQPNFWNVVFGCTPADSPPNAVILRFYDTQRTLNGWFGQQSGGWNYPTISAPAGRHVVRLQAGRLTVDDQEEVFSFYRPHVPTASVYLFGGNCVDTPSETPWRPIRMKCRRFSIWRGGELVMDLKPVLDPSGVACMRDEVSEDMFYSANEKTFTAGPEA